MQLDDIAGNVADQERGRWFDLLEPVTGAPTGIRFRCAGPDSETQHKARLKLSDALAEMADPDGRVTAAQREKARIDALASCVLGWEITEDGQPLPFTHKNVVRVLSLAFWVQAQVDAFAADRRNFIGGD